MAKIAKKQVLPGTVRIRAKDITIVEKTSKYWRKSKKECPEAMHVIKLFKAHKVFNELIDRKDPRFLKGQLSPDGKTQGARINILPDGQRLDKAYSLFADHLNVHDEKTNQHWDVLYRNPGGTYSYVYTLDKKKGFMKKKYEIVGEFEKHYPRLKRKVSSALKNKEDHLALPMFTLLKTYMRIGNEIYYKAHGHKGLTTLKKHDISIKGNHVTFNYLAKDGVPVEITEKFPDIYIARLSRKLKPIDKSSFVFTNRNKEHPLHEEHFRDAFKRYCGREFYPHIVRSHFATRKTKEFLNNHGSASKEEVRALFISIAEKLGHKKYDKKNDAWKDNFTVTVNHYIQPELVEKVKSIIR